MKKLFILAAIAVASLTACQKKQCWQCTLTTTNSSSDPSEPPTTKSSVIAICDKTKRQIREFEKVNSKTTSMDRFPKTYTTTEKLSCQ